MKPSLQPDLIADIELLTTAAGGRRTAISVEGCQAVLGFGYEFFGGRLDFSPAGSIAPGGRGRVSVTSNFGCPIVPRLAEGMRFSLWEGKVIGYGAVVSRGDRSTTSGRS